ncbi:MAG TPA: chemotaxis protein CheD [Gemmatimonadales bacterium]|jgi:chemotaxis protein CheD
MTHGEIIVRVADLRIGTGDDVLVTVGLGSCVAVLLYDPVARVGGLAHVLLPSPALSRADHNPAKFPQTAIPHLLELMAREGGSSRRMTGRLAGGASMFASLAAPGTIQMGERNVVACRQVLYAHGIPLKAEAVGGDYGRTVKLRVSDGQIEVFTVAHGVHGL